MTDPLKYMLASAAIAIVSATAAGVVVGLVVRQPPAPKPSTVAPSAVRVPTVARQAPSAQSGLPMPLQFKGTNALRAPILSSDALRQVQESPALRQAREAYLDAQKKYVAAIQSAASQVEPTKTQGLAAKTNAPAPATLPPPAK